ncbi:YdcF family protein [Ferroacidibacillus organovorans]|uniref:DUF218 domain-containing protein n=1 Tax=Ferroacidibacillus organovorans TaxID=1765683 RepID=A0A101XTC4_9BACL|nr:YdcF family protein [Ferroacidibacillus organovorans]KUO97209.1 hypothetical protein ATW55_09840 [Ferroacidibacillus organovorans]
MANPLIPKEPIVPDLTSKQIEQLTDITFLPDVTPVLSDAVFVFGGTHPGHWERPIEAYKKGLSKKIIVTGGVSPTGIKHTDWKSPNTPEAEIIIAELLQNGVRRKDIVYENRSRNTLENILFTKEVFDFSTIQSVLIVCKNHAAGRQYRTFAKHIPYPISCISFGFDAEYRGRMISRNEWMNSEAGRARVFGEYLRIVYYGRLGHVLPLESEITDLNKYVELNVRTE